jgi:hypothetical protein
MLHNSSLTNPVKKRKVHSLFLQFSLLTLQLKSELKFSGIFENINQLTKTKKEFSVPQLINSSTSRLLILKIHPVHRLTESHFSKLLFFYLWNSILHLWTLMHLQLFPCRWQVSFKNRGAGPYFSEFGLIRYRIRVEIEYFIALTRYKIPNSKESERNISKSSGHL